MSDFTIEQLEALIAEKRAHQELRDRIGRLRDWHSERGELMCNLYEESLDREFKDKSDSHSFTANQLSAILDPRDEEQEQKVARTLAEMTPEERQACVGMWCDNLISAADVPAPLVLACVQGELCWILHTSIHGERSCFPLDSVAPRFDMLRAWSSAGTPLALSG